MKWLSILFLFLSATLFNESRGEQKPKVNYQYKKYEKFDFEDLSIEGSSGAPGDLSITPRYQQLYKNRLPYRKNFNAEIMKSVERIK